MKLKYFLIPLSFILLIGCKTNYPSKGYFSQYIALKDNNYFVTGELNSSNNLSKLTDGELCYYTWKTLKYNKKIDSSSYITSYKTVLNNDLKKLKDKEKWYLNQENNLLNNYLFFIDNYRCIYFSRDDKRTNDNTQDILLYFDTDNYKLDNTREKSYSQLLRGYYIVNEDNIFINFEKDKKFYIKGKIKENKIYFDSTSIPNTTSPLYNEGVNTIYKKYTNMIDTEIIFEKPDTLLRNLHFKLSFGFELSKNAKLKMHKKMNEIHGDGNTYIIDSITYNFDEPESYYRKYTYHISKKDGKKFTINEPISIEPVYDKKTKKYILKNLIQTW